MAFDEAKFRELAKGKFSDEEIDAAVQSQLAIAAAPSNAIAPTSVPIPNSQETTQSFDDQANAAQTKIKQDFDVNRQKNLSGDNFNWQGLLSSTPALVAGTALLSTLTTLAAPKVIKSIKQRSIKGEPDLMTRVEPTFDAPVIIETPPNLPETPVIDRVKAAKDLVEANRQAGLGSPAVPPQGPAAPAIPPQLGSAVAPAPIPQAGVTNAVATGGDVKQAIQETLAKEIDGTPAELRTGTGKQAYAGTGPAAQFSPKTGKPKLKPEYASMADVPTGYAFIPDAQYIDALRQDLGQAEYTKAFTGQNFPATYEQAQTMGKDINRSLGRPSREEAKLAGLPKGEITPGITQMTSSGKKGVTIKGLGIGALTAIPDIAKANTGQERSNALLGLLEAVLPPGFTMSGAGEGSANVPDMGSAALLGSPFAQTEAAERMRRDQEMSRRIAGRTGDAVPPQLRR
jgi:hypothetical protein